LYVCGIIIKKMANKYSKTPCNIKMVLSGPGVYIEKICTNLWDVYVFERDIPTKHGLQFSKKPYYIGKTYLDAITRTA
jgi:hypothetical protein